MSVSRQIGNYKRQQGLQIVQPKRYQEVINARLAEGQSLGLSTDFVQKIVQAIHEESVRQQLN